MLISSLFSILYFTIHHRRQRTHKRGHDRWGDNPGRIHTAILASVRDHIDRYQLQGRNIQNQKRAHLIAGNPAALSICRHRQLTAALTCLVPLFLSVCKNAFPCRHIPRRPPLFLQLRQFLHRLQSPLCLVNDTKFKNNIIIVHQYLFFLPACFAALAAIFTVFR